MILRPYLCKLKLTSMLVTPLMMVSFVNESRAMNLPNTEKNIVSPTNTFQFEALTPPHAEKREYSTVHHGIELPDPYAYLRDKDWKTPEDGVKDPDVMNYLLQENAYSAAFFEPLKPEIDRLFQQWKGYIPDVVESLKMKDGGYFYYTRQLNDQNYPLYLRIKDAPDAQEEIYFDVNKEGHNHQYYHVGGKRVSPDDKWLAYSEDTMGNEFHTLYIRNLEIAGNLPETIENVSGGVAWAPDNTGFFYLKHNDEWHTLYLYYHVLGTSPIADTLIFEEKDQVRSLGMAKTDDEKYLIVETGSKDDEEIYVIDLSDPTHKMMLVAPRIEKRKITHVTHHKGYFYMVMNDTGPNYRVIRVPVDAPLSGFEEIVPHDFDVYITSYTAFETQHVMTLKKLGLETVVVMDPETREMRHIPMDDSCYDLSVITNKYEDDHFWIETSSLARPRTTYQVNLNDLTQTIVKVQEVASGFDQSLYQVDRIWAEGRDGVKVPVSVAYRKDKFKFGADNPLLLYGYGSYGYGIDPAFSHRCLSYMDNGFVYVIAHIRGGDDLGYQWYLDGKDLKKENTFHDFIDIAHTLIKLGYAKKGGISAMGGSAGGMLMGYIANNAPDLFKAIAALVPFVDVMNTMLDKSLPLTEGEFKEWGNPIESKEHFEYMKSYSPYDNVKKQAYPAMLITGGLTDPRVTYWEPTKWMAKLREMHTGDQPLLLKMIMSAGHGGGSKRDEKIHEEAEILAFFEKVHGLLKMSI